MFLEEVYWLILSEVRSKQNIIFPFCTRYLEHITDCSLPSCQSYCKAMGIQDLGEAREHGTAHQINDNNFAVQLSFLHY